MAVKYRKSEVRMWTDAAFCELSAPPPNGQTLWLYLLTGPRTTAIPGCIVATDVVLADDLGWDLEGFRKAFSEIENLGLATADWGAGLVVLSKALIDDSGNARDTNKPGNPNILRGWANTFEELPDCDLKSEVLSRIKSLSQSLSKGFAKAFDEGFRKALGKASVKPLGKALAKPLAKAFTQEQEQEQEERDTPLLFSEPTEAARDLAIDLAAACCEALNAATGSSYQPTASETRKLARRLAAKRVTPDDVRAVVADRVAEWADDPKMRSYLRPATLLAGKFHAYLDDARSRPSTSVPAQRWQMGSY